MAEPPSVVHGQGSVEPKRGNGDLNAGVNRRRKVGGGTILTLSAFYFLLCVY